MWKTHIHNKFSSIIIFSHLDGSVMRRTLGNMSKWRGKLLDCEQGFSWPVRWYIWHNQIAVSVEVPPFSSKSTCSRNQSTSAPHFEPLSPGFPSFSNRFPLPFPFRRRCFCQSTRLGEGLKDLGRLGPMPYRNHLPSGRLNYLEMSQLHCYLYIVYLNTNTALTT